MDPDVIITRLRKELPPTFTRKYICTVLGGYFTQGGLSNLDSAGLGPGGVRLGKYMVYEREAFLAWLRTRMTAGRKVSE